jgi:hypothetical protein
MMTRERDDSGQYTETVTLDAVLGVFDQVRGPVITSSDVADALDCTTEAARQKLGQLTDRGDLDRRKTGRTTIYWRAESDTDGHEDAPRDDESAPASEPVETSPDRVDGHLGDDSAPPGDVSGEYPLGASVPAFLDAPRGIDRRAALEAVDAVRSFLHERGPASQREIVRAVMPDHPLGYDVPDLEPGDRFRGAWWRRVVKPALTVVDDVEYRKNHQDYHYVGGQ